MLKIPKTIQDALFAHALEINPNECCGLLAGRGEQVTHHFQVQNSDHSPTTYLMDPREQIWAFKNMRHNHLDLLAIYHSHTHTPAYPSATDIRLAYDPDCYYLIITLMQRDNPQMRIFRILEGKVSEDQFEVI